MAHKNILRGRWGITGVFPATRRVWRRRLPLAAFVHKSRYINGRGAGRSRAISLPTAPAAEEVTQMATIWKSTNPATNKANKNTISGTMLSSWSRQQKLAMLASFVILGLLLAVSACSKQSPKPALVSVSSPTSSSPTPGAAALSVTTPTAVTAPAPAKKTPKKRPANVTYSDVTSGVSFLYPRKFALISGDRAQPHIAAVSMYHPPTHFPHPAAPPASPLTPPPLPHPAHPPP